MNWLREYKSSLKMPEVEEITDLLIYRPLAFLLVISILRTRIKPDHLTLAAMLMGVIGGIFYGVGGTQANCTIGAIFYLFFNILDCSDGQLARIKKNGSAVGRLLDGIADYIAAIAVYVGIATGYSGMEGQPPYFVMLVGLAGLSIIVQESLVDFYRTRFLDIVLQRKNTFNEGIEEYRKEYVRLRHQKGQRFNKFVIFIYLAYSKLQRNLTGKRKKIPVIKSTPENYYRKNRLIIRLWIIIGPSAKITTLIICSFFCRFDIFFWIVIGLFNILALLLWVIQFNIDKTFETE